MGFEICDSQCSKDDHCEFAPYSYCNTAGQCGTFHIAESYDDCLTKEVRY